ncbi:MAG: hypothetical protein AB9873_18755 [Syntrophobacteraceae bacterium]
MLGKIGRSLLLPTTRPLLSLVITLLIALASVILFLVYARRLQKGELQTLPEAGGAIVYLCLSASILVYLFLVASGRTGLRPEAIKSPTEVFIFGFIRFHYFWVTLLWPWVAAAFFGIARRSKWFCTLNSSRIIAIALILVLFPIMWSNGAFKHSSYYRMVGQVRAQGVNCIKAALRDGRAIDCPELYPSDITAYFTHAKSLGSSFCRSLDIPP